MKFKKDRVRKPTKKCRYKISKIESYIHNTFQLVPHSFEPSFEGGLMLDYWNKEINRSVYIEVDNDLDVSVLVTENLRAMINRLYEKTEDEKFYSDLPNLFEIFKGKNDTTT